MVVWKQVVRKLSNFRSLIFFLFKKHLFQVNIQSIQISNSLSKFFFLLRGTFSFLHSQDLGKGFLVSSQLLGTQTWVSLASHLGLCGHTLFRLWDIVTAFMSKIPEASLSVPQTSSSLVPPLPLGPPGEPKNFSANFWSFGGFPRVPPSCHYHLYCQALLDKTPCQNQGFSARLSDFPGECGTSTSIFWILLSYLGIQSS